MNNINGNFIGIFNVTIVASKSIYFNLGDLNIQELPEIYDCFIASEVDYSYHIVSSDFTSFSSTLTSEFWEE